MALDTTTPRSRRTMLAAALGGLGALVANALGRPATAQAAAGDTLKIGQSNDSGSSQTVLTSSAGGASFTLKDTAVGGTGIFGWSSGATGAGRGLYGRADSPTGYGVQAKNNGATGTGAALQALGGNNTGIDASTASSGGRRAIKATAASSGAVAIEADGEATSGIGVLAYGANGVAGYSSAESYAAVYGLHTAGTLAAYGVYGSTYSDSASATGVYGEATFGNGVYGSSQNGLAVYGKAPGPGTGVEGFSYSGIGVFGHSNNTTGISAFSNAATGLVCSGGGTYSAYISGLLYADSASASIKSFRIDHPLDPANKILSHSCVESNERKLVYDGVVTTDAKGEATVVMPSYFTALNRDVRYQLTVIGAFAQAIVKSEMSNGRFSIVTSEPRTKVSWQVTGVRQDAVAKANPLVVEQAKTGLDKGRYLNPLAHDQPESSGVFAQLRRPVRGATIAPPRSAVQSAG